jgi:hypothetical protein
MRKKHPHKEIEAAIQYALKQGWELKESGNSAHSWGRLKCGEKSRQGCQISIWSTPRNPYNHAQQIRRAVDRCQHGGDENENL